MMCWARWTSYTGWHLVLCYGHATTSGNYYAMGTSATTGPNNLVVTNPSGLTTSGATPTTGTWYHICQTVAGTGAGQHLGYRDGSLIATNAGSTSPTAGKIWIGNNQDTDYHNGDVCAVKIYNAVLTAAEIQQEMRQIAPVRFANLNTWLPLLDGANLEKDWSGVSGNMTAGGTVTLTSNPPVPFRASKPKTTVYISAGGGGSVGGPLRRPMHARYKMRHKQPDFIKQNDLRLPNRELYLGRAS